MKSISDCLVVAPDVAAVVARGLVDRCSWLPLVRRNPPLNFPLHCKPTKSRIRSFISALAQDVTPQVRDGVTWFPGEDFWKVIRSVKMELEI